MRRSEDLVIEHVFLLRDLRQLALALMNASRRALENDGKHIVLVLHDPKVGNASIEDMWDVFRSLSKPGISDRISLGIYSGGIRGRVLGPLSPEEQHQLESAIHQRDQKHNVLRRQRSHEAFFDILRVLLIHWFRNDGPLPIKMLREETGFSYPTIAAALRRLETDITRQSNRSAALKHFPRDAWFKLLAHAEDIRCTAYFSDRSGRPRPLDALLERLRDLGRGDIAIGGVTGARHYFPGLDIVGTPRLDLVQHATKGTDVHEWVRSLDPALTPSNKGEPPRIAVHTLMRPLSFFQTGTDGRVWADHVECLLDLHDAHLEALAQEFLDRLTSGVAP